MPFLIAIVGLFLPQLVALLLWLFSDWFTGVFETRIWPVLGFFFLPLTMLWYSAVENWFAGAWNWWQILVLIIAILMDLHSGKNSAKKRG